MATATWKYSWLLLDSTPLQTATCWLQGKPPAKLNQTETPTVWMVPVGSQQTSWEQGWRWSSCQGVPQ